MSPAPKPESSLRHGPFLVQGRRRRRTFSPLILWHLLSLDAPTVAAVWVSFFAWCAGVRCTLFDPATMFIAVWLLYVADRLLDAKPLFSEAHAPELRERHRFHHQHRSRFLLAAMLACPPFLFLLHHTDDRLLHLYASLAALLAGWLVLVHAHPAAEGKTDRLPKELAVGVFFSAAIFIPTVGRAPWLRLTLLPHALLFACLCSLNCLFLYAWEHSEPTKRAHVTTRWSLQRLRLLAAGLTGLATLLAFLSASRKGSSWNASLAHPAASFFAVALSGALLLLLHTRRASVSALKLRSLADLVLLSPIPVMLGVLLWQHVC